MMFPQQQGKITIKIIFFYNNPHPPFIKVILIVQRDIKLLFFLFIWSFSRLPFIEFKLTKSRLWWCPLSWFTSRALSLEMMLNSSGLSEQSEQPVIISSRFYPVSVYANTQNCKRFGVLIFSHLKNKTKEQFTFIRFPFWLKLNLIPFFWLGVPSLKTLDFP